MAAIGEKSGSQWEMLEVFLSGVPGGTPDGIYLGVTLVDDLFSVPSVSREGEWFIRILWAVKAVVKRQAAAQLLVLANGRGTDSLLGNPAPWLPARKQGAAFRLSSVRPPWELQQGRVS